MQDLRAYFSGSFNESPFRYERKFIIPQLPIERLMNEILTHPASFKETFYKRRIYNIYFDKYDLDFFKKNIEGDCERSKVRLRWYGNKNIIKPRLEIKTKKGYLGKKYVFTLKKVCLKSKKNTKSVLNQILRKNKLHLISSKILLPTLYNSYSRSYFISADSNFRITIDQGQTFQSPTHNFSNATEFKSNALIMELKYHHSLDHLANGLTQFFPFRVSKNSKYVNGINMINRFKNF